VLLPGYPNPVRLGIEVDWDPAGLPLSGLESSLHAVTAVEAGGRTLIRLARPERVDRDFILRGRLCPDQIQASAILVADGDGEAGTLMVTVLPRRRLARPGGAGTWSSCWTAPAAWRAGN